MTLTVDRQVTSLEISKKLEELGVKQESLFYWVHDHVNDIWEIVIDFNCNGMGRNYDWNGKISAFTVSELGEMLFKSKVNCRSRSIQDLLPQYWSNHNKWEIHCTHYYNEKGNQVVDLKIDIIANTEADARGKMLIYLIENGLLKKENV